MNDGQKSIVNSQTLKYIGVFKFLNPQSPKIYDINIYKLIAKIELLFSTLSLILTTFSIYYSSYDMNLCVPYIFYFVSIFEKSLFQYYIIKYSDNIWDFMHVINKNFIVFNNPIKEPFSTEPSKYKIAMRTTLYIWVFVSITWIFTPLVQQKNYRVIHFRNNIYNYHYSVFNFIIPITDKIYNEYFIIIYVIEAIVMICFIHMAILYDSIVITSCISIEYQLQRIANSYSAFKFVGRHVKSKQ